MTTIKDIAKFLMARHQLKNSDAELFLQQIVEVINEGLIADRQVKIKGFGTFKLQTVKERSSVNISTGERVTIGEHDKVTFTPDNVMRDLINKPFAQFETITIDSDTVLPEDFNIESEVEDNIVSKVDEAIEEVQAVTTPDEEIKTAEESQDIIQETSELNEENQSKEEIVSDEISEETKPVVAPVMATGTDAIIEEDEKELDSLLEEQVSQKETTEETVEEQIAVSQENTDEIVDNTEIEDTTEISNDDIQNNSVETGNINAEEDSDKTINDEDISEDEDTSESVVSNLTDEIQPTEEEEKSNENIDTEDDTEEVYYDEDDYEEGFFDKFGENAFNAQSLLLSAIVAILFFVLGYYASQNGWFGNSVKSENTESRDSTTFVQNTLTNEEKDTTFSVAENKLQENKENVEEKKTEDSNSKSSDDKTEDIMVKYSNDARIRTGAYIIIGTEREVTVREGQTLKSIAKAYLGPDMECYVEAYNNTKTVKAGQVIKIPKLKLKKKLKK